jgi:hypothetical protein
MTENVISHPRWALMHKNEFSMPWMISTNSLMPVTSSKITRNVNYWE